MDLIRVSKESCKLDGPFECPSCGGRLMLDASLGKKVKCLYCNENVNVPTEKGGNEIKMEAVLKLNAYMEFDASKISQQQALDKIEEVMNELHEKHGITVNIHERFTQDA